MIDGKGLGYLLSLVPPLCWFNICIVGTDGVEFTPYERASSGTKLFLLLVNLGAVALLLLPPEDSFSDRLVNAPFGYWHTRDGS